MGYRQRIDVYALGRRLTGLCLLVGVCASFVPLPLAPLSEGAKDRSTPYPCQDHPCGCRSAEQCWKQCCCMTNAQKLVWSRKNGVTPPEYVVAAAAREGFVPKPASAAKSCCHSTGKCERGAADNPGCSSAGCTESSRWRVPREFLAQAKANKPEPGAKDRKKSTQTVIGALMMRCQGHSSYWNALPWGIVPRPLDVPRLVRPLEKDVVLDFACVPQRADRPPVPPPRV